MTENVSILFKIKKKIFYNFLLTFRNLKCCRYRVCHGYLSCVFRKGLLILWLTLYPYNEGLCSFSYSNF